MRRLRRVGFGSVYLLAMSIIMPPASEAASFAVTLFTDANSGGLAGTGAGAAGDLRAAILAANASAGADTITFACGSSPCTITLTGPLPPITGSLTMDGGTLGNIVVSGANAYRVFFVDTGAVTFRNLVIQNGRAQGGAGGSGDGGGGGGAGLGGGLFVNQAGAAVTLTNVRFLNCSAIGGAGGSFQSHAWAGGGGGGLAFRGGISTANGGGAGGGGVLAAGGDTAIGNGGAGGAGGGAGGGRHFSSAAGGGSTGYATNPGGAAGNVADGGAGGFGGGGGGAALGVGGPGGFGGGGGGTGASGAAGAGGPGGGGGGADGGAKGMGGVLGSAMKGGDGGAVRGAGGGGGAAVGPAVFVNAGSLTVSNATATGSTATAGAGGTGDLGNNGTAGTANATALFNYGGTANNSTTTGPLTLLDAPTVTSVSPGSGPPSGGNTVTITGTNFTGATSVMFEGTAATSFTVASATTITAVVPAHAAGSANVVVTTPGGSNSVNSLYQYLTPVPTLGEWGMLGLAALLILYGCVRLRGRREAGGMA